MAVQFKLEKRHIISGKYVGSLRSRNKGTPTPGLEMIHLGDVVGSVNVTPVNADGDHWEVLAEVPSEFLMDGVQTFLFVLTGQTEILDRFSVITGEPLEEDLRAEINLLREELDMVKRAFRRHCIETLGG